MKQTKHIAILLVILLFCSITGAFASAQLAIIQTELGNIFTDNAPVSFFVSTNADTIEYTVYDYWDNIVSAGAKEVGASPESLIIPMTKKGVFRLDLLAVGSIGIAKKSTTFAVIDSLSMAEISANSPFVVQTHLTKGSQTASWNNIEDVLNMSKNLGFKTVRNNMRWTEIETERGVYNFKQSHADFMEALTEKNMQLYFVAAEYNSLYENWTPDFYEGFSNYVAACIEEYPNKIKWIEVLNEPNTSHGPPGYPDTAAQGAEYARLLRAVYERVKAIDPTIKIVAGATCDNGREFFGGMFRADTDSDGYQDGVKFCDAISYHLYEFAPNTTINQYNQTDTLVKQYNNGVSIPIYLSETGYSTIPNIAEPIGEDEMWSRVYKQARFLPVQLVDAVAGFKANEGIISLYELLNDTANRTSLEDNFGLFRCKGDPWGDFTPRWSFGTVATLNRQLNGYNFSSLQILNQAISNYHFTNGSDELRFFSSVFGKYTITCDSADPIEVIDMMGNSQIISPVSGKVSFNVDECPVYVKGSISGEAAVAASDNFIYQAEGIPTTTNGTKSNESNALFSGGSGLKLTPTGQNNYIEYRLSVTKAATYKITLRQSRNNLRGIYKITLNGEDFGNSLDCYYPNSYITEDYLGTVTLPYGGHYLRFANTGKNGASSGTALLADAIVLTEVSSATALSLSDHSINIKLHSQPYKITATVTPQAKPVEWSSSDENVAIVINGYVEAVSLGEATITAVSGDKTATCRVNVSGNTLKASQIFNITKNTNICSVGGNSVNENYYSISELYARNVGGQYRIPLIGADLTSLNGLQVKKAMLYLNYINDQTQYYYNGGGIISFYEHNSEWDEKTATFNTGGGTAVGNKIGEIVIPADENDNFSYNKFHGVDITDYLNSLDNKNVSIKVIGDKNAERYKFCAREFADISRRPMIFVEMDVQEDSCEPEYVYKDFRGVPTEGLSPMGSVEAVSYIPASGYMYLALYGADNELIDVQCTEKAVESNQISAKIEKLPQNITNYRIKAYVWNNNLTPYQDN